MRSLAENFEIACDYAGLGTTYVGPAHKLIGATDADMGKTVEEWFAGKGETEQVSLYGAIRAATIKWSKMRERGSASQDEGGEVSPSDTLASNGSSSVNSVTGNSVQSLLSSTTVENPNNDNSASPKRQGKRAGTTTT